MGRDDNAFRAEVGHDLDEDFGIQTEDGPAVGAEVSETGEFAVEPVYRIKIRGQDQEVNLAYLASLGVDEADLGGEDEGDVPGRESHGPEVFVFGGDDVFQPVKPVSFGLQLLSSEEKPFGMGKIGDSQKPDSLDFGPVGEGVKGHFAGGSP